MTENNTDNEIYEVSLLDLLVILTQQRRFIVKVTAAFAVIAIVASARRRIALVSLGAVGSLAVFASVTMTAYSGSSWLAPELGVGMLGIFGVVLAAVAVVLTIRSFTSHVVAPDTQTLAPVG